MQSNGRQCTLNLIITIIRKMQFINFMSEGYNRFGQQENMYINALI